ERSPGMSLITDDRTYGLGFPSASTRASEGKPRRRTRPQLLSALLTIGLLLAVSLRAGGAPEHAARQRDVRSDPVMDLAVLANPSGSYTAFVADSRSGTIRYGEVEAVKDIESWSLQSFRPFVMKGAKVPRYP